ncbi:MAG: capsular polysaccharide synthesis protein [Vibrio sp.]
MKFSKQIKSLDRKIAPLRKKFPLISKTYNHLNKINLNNSFHNESSTQILTQKAHNSLNSLLEPTKINAAEDECISKIIWIYWDTGFENAPEVVKLSVKSWVEMNPDYEVKLLSNDNLYTVLGFNFYDAFQLSTVRCLTPIKADILRLHILSKHGGVWVDATTFCLKPLSNWLPKATEKTKLFTFKHKGNKTRPIEVWLIAVSKNNQIINNILNKFIEIIFKPREISLFISGKVPLLETVPGYKNAPLTSDIIYNAEKMGFMPYFSFGYLFYEELKNNLSDEMFTIFMREDEHKIMENRFTLTKGDFDDFSQSVVSKQTYIGSYVQSDLYKKRKASLLNKLDNNEYSHND